MQISHAFEINEEEHVVLENGIELGMTRERYMYTQLLQNYDMEILLAIDGFCKKHGITYYLAEGTLLGAIRHGGFIPWDDDVDICMFREDYERFLKLAAEDFPEGFVVDCPLTNPGHWTILAQVEMTRPVPYLKKRLEGISLYQGPCVDVFPIDDVPTDDPAALEERSERIRTLKRALWIKSGLHKRGWYKKFKKRMQQYYPLKIYGMTRSMETLRSEVFDLMQQTADPNSEYIANFASLYKIGKEVFPRAWFGQPRMVDFEGYQLPCPAESEQVLKRTYGNYRAMPLIKKRDNKHFFSSNEEVMSKIDDQEVVQIVLDLQAQRERDAQKAKEELAALEAQGIKPPKEDSPMVKKAKSRIRKVKNFNKRRIYDLRSQRIQEYMNEPVREKTVFFDAFSGLGILDSPRAIFKRMLERDEFKDYQFIWTINEKKIVKDNINEFSHLPNVTIVKRDGQKYLQAMATAQYLVSNSSLPTFFARREDQYYLNTWHGVPTKIMGYERPGQKVISTKNVTRNFLNATHIVSANDFTAQTMYKQAYLLEGAYEGKLLDSPLPRTDAIYNTSRDYVMDKMRQAGIHTDKKIIIYAPTWKGDNYKNFDEDTTQLREAVHTIQSRINGEEYQVFLRVHYFLYRVIKQDPELSKICIPFTIDTNELLSITDILISDYSSIFFDFLGTRRPILFYVPDLEEYEENRGLYIPMEEMPGPVSQTLEGIADYINDLDKVQKEYHDRYEAMWQWCSSREDGQVTDRIIDAFILGREMPTIDCHTQKKKLLVMAEWHKDFTARNELEQMFKDIDYDKYDVTLLAGSPRGRVMNRSLEDLDPHVRILINDRKINSSHSIRKRIYDGLENGTVTSQQAHQELQIDREWKRLFGDMQFDELMMVQPEKRAFQLWYILMTYAPVKKKGFIISSSGLKDLYEKESNMQAFDMYQTIGDFKKTL